MTHIYRSLNGRRVLVAEFPNATDAALCFKSMAYSLNERLVMVSDSSPVQVPIRGCRVNGIGEYVLDPAFASDSFSR